MKVAYTKPALGERYLVSKKQARAIVKAVVPELDLLAFQTMHVPKSDRNIPYLATFTAEYLRVLSVPEKCSTLALAELFEATVLPHVCEMIKQYRQVEYYWPSVIVCVDNNIHGVSCSDGGQFPNRNEILMSIKKNPHPICKMIME